MNTAVEQAIIDLKFQADILFQEGAIMTAMNVSLAAKIVERYLQIEKEQQLNLIRFVRLNDKMGKSVDDLYNEFYNQNK